MLTITIGDACATQDETAKSLNDKRLHWTLPSAVPCVKAHRFGPHRLMLLQLLVHCLVYCTGLFTDMGPMA